ncbi:MAG: EscU/YscU/HrcU family type III secretion system export apparatus switch protein [Halieaceae bacterium]|jgi:flagellar biosynthesis protein|nr:EscU/YscU/HrcU family type III secretion system export apparatus switch protein [Halieaceae bacterium]
MARQSSGEGAKGLKSVALSYSGTGAPVLVAKGSGDVASRILETAREHDVPVVEDGQLAAVLSQVDLGDEIPPALYVAVAEVLAYVYRLSESIDQRS